MEPYELKTLSDEETTQVLLPYKKYDGAMMLEQGYFILLNWGYLLKREDN